MTKGIRVGPDVTSVNSDLVFTSEAQSLKLSEQFHDKVKTFTVSGAAVGTVTIVHNFGYRPVFRLFVEANAGSGVWYNDSNVNDTLDNTSSTIFWTVLDINENTVNVFFSIPQDGTYRFKYWIFEDSLDKF